MSRGQVQPRNQSGKRPLTKHRDKGTHDNVVIIDEESSLPISKGSGTSRPDKKQPSRGLTIIIDDDEDGDTYRISDQGGDIESDATSSKKYQDVLEDPYDDECQMFVCERKPPFKSYKCTKPYPRKGPFRNRFGLFPESESSTSKSDGSDCEVMEGSSGKIREQWEKASSRKQMLKGVQNIPFEVEDQASASGSNIDPNNFSCENVSKDGGVVESSNDDNTKQDDLSDCAPAGDGIVDDHSLEAETDHDITDSGGQLSDTVAVTNQTFDANKNKQDDLSGGKDTGDEIMEEYSFKAEINNPGGDSDVQLSDTSIPNQTFDINNTNQEDLFSCAATIDGIVDERSLKSEINNPVSQSDGQSSNTAAVDQTVDENNTEQVGPSGCAPTANGIMDEHSLKPEVSQSVEISQSVADSDDQLSNTAVVNQIVDEVDNRRASFRDREKLVSGELSLSNPRTQDETYARNLISDGRNGDGVIELQNNLVAQREKLKETAAYRLAEEEEWASRQRELQIQAEEAQRLRKRKKAQTMRLLDMERRQKQRVEEMRETQKKGEETINLKEQLRVEIRKELDKLESKFRDMASLLRSLGIHVEGGFYPMSHEVNAAYKQALLRFHPDRASRWDIRRQVEAEETFKLITRLKDKLLPAI